MLGVRILPPPSAPPCYPKPTTSYNPFCFSHLFQSKTRKKHLFFCPQSHHNLSSSLLLGRTGFCLFATNKQKDSNLSISELERRNFESGFEIVEVDGDEFDEGFVDGNEFVEGFDDDEEFDEGLDDDDDDEDEDVMLPFDKMDAWLKKKPKGFGEGKVYDTSLEDKLLEELEKSRKAQLANLEKRKNKAQEPKMELKKEVNKVSEVAPGVVRVRINNLPKKMNIHRDLNSAFSGVHGIMNTLPVVSGTKKTRDPICKGFAFVDFKSAEDADRFVQMFSGQNIPFGKTGKRIKCEILKSHDTHSEKSLHEGYNSNSGSEEEGVQIYDIGENVLEPVSWEEDDEEFDEPVGKLNIPQSVSWDDDDDDDEFDEADAIWDLKPSKLMKEHRSSDGAKSRVLQSLKPLSTKLNEKKAVKRKPVGEKKPDNNSKLNVLQSGSWEEDDDDQDFDEYSNGTDVSVNNKPSSSTEQYSSDVAESGRSQSLESMSTKPKVKKAVKKKPVPKKKPDDSSKLKVPGSAKRLKVQDKAKLADVYRRYGERQDVISKEM